MPIWTVKPVAEADVTVKDGVSAAMVAADVTVFTEDKVPARDVVNVTDADCPGSRPLTVIGSVVPTGAPTVTVPNVLTPV
mgnify:CR=1 FL=1